MMNERQSDTFNTAVGLLVCDVSPSCHTPRLACTNIGGMRIVLVLTEASEQTPEKIRGLAGIRTQVFRIPVGHSYH